MENLFDATSVLNPVIVNNEWLLALDKLSNQLPNSDLILLECRLLLHESQIDLCQSFVPEDFNVLSEFLKNNKAKLTAWDFFSDFLKQYSTLNEPFLSSLKQIGLEYDIHLKDEKTTSLPPPALFLKLAVDEDAKPKNELLAQTLAQYCTLLIGEKIAPQFVTSYLKCLDSLPPDAAPSYIGCMSSRTQSALRVQFRFTDKKQIEPYLKSIGLDSIPATLTTALDLTFEYFKSTVLCFDLTPKITPRIGLELFPPKGKKAEKDELTEQFLNQLVKQGLCSKQKRDALLAWPCSIDPRNSKEDWPDALILQSLQKPENYLSVINRKINHFKLVCQAGQAIEAKIYLELEDWVKC